MSIALPMRAAFEGKRVLVTGHTGFKGSWLAWWLVGLGARVTGLALAPEYRRGPFVKARLDDVLAHVEGDVRDSDLVQRVIQKANPDYVFHLAAQPLVRLSYREPVATLATNVMGTANVLDALRRRARPCVAVVVTSDKCYENREWVHGYRETDAMGGHDVYSMSKGCAELVASSYRRSFFGPASRILLATGRAGNVIGPGDWSTDRIVPDAVTALAAGKPLLVRNPHAIRPWQHVLEPLAGYLRLAERMKRGGAEFAEAWNFGPAPESARNVADLADRLVAAWGSGGWVAQQQRKAPHEAGFLRLSIDKSVAGLGWRPVWNFDRTVAETVRGYRELLGARNPGAARSMMDAEIARYVTDARAAKLLWTRSR